MLPTVKLDSATTPDGRTLDLFRHDDDFFIQLAGTVIMSSRAHASEEELARLACATLGDEPAPRILIGGLGLGYTLAATLRLVPPAAKVVVAELLEPVIRWNRTVLGHLAGNPLQDRRVQVVLGDVADLLAAQPEGFDAILLDVDNGPEGLTAEANEGLYGVRGLKTCRVALKPGGVLAVWSAFRSPRFTRALQHVGFKVDEVPCRPRSGARGGARSHVVWVARRPRRDHATGRPPGHRDGRRRPADHGGAKPKPPTRAPAKGRRPARKDGKRRPPRGGGRRGTSDR